MKTLQKMLKKGLINQIMKIRKSPTKRKQNKKIIGLMQNQIDGKIKKKFVGIRAKAHIYLTNCKDESKKTKDTKKSNKRKT